MKQVKKIQNSKRKTEKSLSASIPEDIREEQSAGAGSELLGISSLINELVEQNSVKKENVNTSIVLQDYVDWSSVLIPLQETIKSEYNFSADFVDFKHDLSNLLEIDAQIETGISNADLVTCMFVFNELFADKAKVMQFISLLTNKLQPGKLFLLVDSAGSFSQVTVGKNQYMSYTFFDSLKSKFQVVYSSDSKWFRFNQNLSYNIPIENMRYFVRLYRKL
ncbi:25S rRNA-methyltransferase [Smittium culicis]|uniref:25S rRNA-methyltransferase n=1 Tax=Smittium culicis TaxID=133412 RepID=A0A1R1Y1I3_9FUNG|nr:25S rRNA-methyltransferase [Smittium culicis]